MLRAIRIGSDKVSQPRPKSEEKRRNRQSISINAAKMTLRNVDPWGDRSPTSSRITWSYGIFWTYEDALPKNEKTVRPKYCSRPEIINMNEYSNPIVAMIISVFRSWIRSKTNHVAASITSPATSRNRNTRALNIGTPVCVHIVLNQTAKGDGTIP